MVIHIKASVERISLSFVYYQSVNLKALSNRHHLPIFFKGYKYSEKSY